MSESSRLEEGKKRVAEVLAAKREERARQKPVVPAPRYDEVYWAGLEWLDSL